MLPHPQQQLSLQTTIRNELTPFSHVPHPILAEIHFASSFLPLNYTTFSLINFREFAHYIRLV